MFNLEEYETVDERIHKFWATFQNGKIWTELLETVRGENGQPFQYVVKAHIYRDVDDVFPAATGYAEEIVGSSPVNKTSALENAETSAIGRALANLGLSTKGQRPSQTEMAKVEANWESQPVKGTETVIRQPQAQPSEKQIMALVNKTNKVSVNADFHKQFWQFCLAGGENNGDAPITKGEASQLIGMDHEDFAGYAAAFFGSLLEDNEDVPF